MLWKAALVRLHSRQRASGTGARLGHAVDDLNHLITPELALVDPALAAEARELLPLPGDCLAPRRPPVAAMTWHAQPVVEGGQVETVRPELSRRRRSVQRIAIALTWLVVAAILGSSLLAFIPPRGSSRPQLPPPVLADEPSKGADKRESDAPMNQPPMATLPQPGTSPGRPMRPIGAVTTEKGGLEIRWRPTARAVFYNVAVFRDGKRIDLWCTATSVSLAAPRQLWLARRAAGIRYRWFVYPAYTSGGTIEFGRDVARGSIVARST